VNLPVRFDHTFRVEVTIAFVVFGLVAVAFLLALVRSMTERGNRASPKTSYKKTEMIYVSLVSALAIFLVVFSLAQNRSPDPKSAMTVNVTGFQWCWRFVYVGTAVSVTADCVDGSVPTLVVPAGEVVKFDVTSSDVIHSMWIPSLRYKLLAYPNFVNTFETTFHQTGSWTGECAEFCGLYHFAMRFRVQVLPAGQFRAWLQARGGSAA
jgi:cytochrome c oxidase subunit 2